MNLLQVVERNGERYVSAQYLERNGVKINPLSTLCKCNKLLYDDNGNFIDLLIPCEDIESNIIDRYELILFKSKLINEGIKE